LTDFGLAKILTDNA
jgi:serum/glucocorticoid-regulated kinase 2